MREAAVASLSRRRDGFLGAPRRGKGGITSSLSQDRQLPLLNHWSLTGPALMLISWLPELID